MVKTFNSLSYQILYRHQLELFPTLTTTKLHTTPALTVYGLQLNYFFIFIFYCFWMVIFINAFNSIIFKMYGVLTCNSVESQVVCALTDWESSSWDLGKTDSMWGSFQGMNHGEVNGKIYIQNRGGKMETLRAPNPRFMCLKV